MLFCLCVHQLCSFENKIQKIISNQSGWSRLNTYAIQRTQIESIEQVRYDANRSERVSLTLKQSLVFQRPSLR